MAKLDAGGCAGIFGGAGFVLCVHAVVPQGCEGVFVRSVVRLLNMKRDTFNGVAFFDAYVGALYELSSSADAPKPFTAGWLYVSCRSVGGSRTQNRIDCVRAVNNRPYAF